VLQDVETNYEIDLFANIIGSIADLAKIQNPDSNKKASMRVIADHLRATNFLMADGVLPSNEGRGYVLRRIMRRAIRHGRNLGFKEPFFWQLTKVLIDEMGATYPELKDKKAYIEENVKLEEERFLQTLDTGLKLLEDAFTQSNDKKIPGQVAFKLYDTYGFPLDLTDVIAKERGYDVNHKEFEDCMEEQRSRSREHWKGSGEESVDALFKQLQTQGLKTTFVGYNNLAASGKISAIIENGEIKKSTSSGKFILVVDQTPFYAESGGQVGDRGSVSTDSGFQAVVTDVKKPTADYFVLHCENAKGIASVGDELLQKVDPRTRAMTAKNHSATHMLHHALRHRLGDHVKQAGSLVHPDFLRFDFTHSKAMTADEITAVENDINESILKSLPVCAEEMGKDAALAKGAIAFFGDKYGDQVRVVSVGDYSVELCGGTHVSNTIEVMGFKILNENGIAAGVRRITAVTGPKVVDTLRKRDSEIKNIMDIMNASAPDEIPQKLQRIIASEKETRRQLDSLQRKVASHTAESWIKEAVELNQCQFVRGVLPTDKDASDVPGQIRDLAESLRSKLKESIIAIAAHDQAKEQVALVVAVTRDLIGRIKAGDIIKSVAPVIEGRGGGKPELAQCGGKRIDRIQEVLKAIEIHIDKEIKP
jgi:alanyl-tRNA synthetase